MLLTSKTSYFKSKADKMAAITSHFAISLFSSIIASNPQDNVVLSPMSISSALALVAAGSKGKTLEEIEKALDWKAGSKDDGLAVAIIEEAKKTAEECTKSCSLKSANGIWLENDLSVNIGYKNFLKKFGIQAVQVDFKRDSARATNMINKWVEEETNKKITKLFENGALDDSTRAVLVNAIYFKGNWLMPFDKKHTSPAPFYVSAEKKVDAKMMYHSGEFRYLYDGEKNCNLVQLEYEGSAFSMILVVPHEVDGLKSVTSGINLAQIAKWKTELERSHKETVDVFLPKFKVSHKVNLKKSFRALGINDLFCDKANLTGISEAGNLFVSSAVHEAVIEVNEEGTEAAGATGIGIGFMSLPPQVRADKPFLFMIVSSKTNGIVFMGKMADPSK